MKQLPKIKFGVQKTCNLENETSTFASFWEKQKQL